MSTTLTTTGAEASSTCTPKLYDIPTHDAACAMPNSNSSYHSLMTSCCGAAAVTSYSDCDYYCLAQNQTVGDLAECLIKGSEAGQVWCNTNANATATGTATATATETGDMTETETEGASASETGLNEAEVSGLNVKSAIVLFMLAFSFNIYH
ncbi:hypothetical protein BDV18DRAFT_141871 [Aspergillus unguis]